MSFGRFPIALSLLAAAACLTARPTHAAVGGSPATIQEVPDGTMLSKDNWEIAKGHLPDEILELYKRGDYTNPIRKLEGKKGTIVDPRLVELSAQNKGKFDVNEEGTVVDVKTGKRPPVIIGWPFPEISPADPKAGTKALWDYLYTLHWAGSFHTVSPLNWVDRNGGVMRRIALDTHFKYYDGQPPEFQERIGENPLNILNRTMAIAREPADLNGLVTLNWRYREGEKEDQAWTYVPALRRVRPVNPANRADGVLGSDLSQDDGAYFDGKPEEFNFKLIGDGWILGTFDNTGLDDPVKPTALKDIRGISPLVEKSEIGWRLSYPETTLIASQEKSWKPGQGLVAWAPIQIALLPRPVWIVEATPKNPYYIFGKQVMYIDKENFRGHWKSKYDWKGNVLMNYQVPESLIQKIDGAPGYMRISRSGGVAIMNNVRADRATVSGLPVADTDWWIDIPDQIFEVDRITRYGK